MRAVHAAIAASGREALCCLPLTSQPLVLQVVSKDIRRILTERARYFGVILDDVSITQVRLLAVLVA